ncbi:Acetyl-CoA acetyltransferase, partial [Zancudomyces culisetae]
ARTAIGSFGGSLSSFSATELGSIALKGALQRSGVGAEQVESIYLGNVISANLGQNPARQVAIGAGCAEDKVVGTTVNKVCASGMKAVALAAQEIRSGDSEIVVVVGTESMSNVPYYAPSNRFGARYGNQSILDGLVRDGLSDAFNGEAMGYAAEKCAADYSITRDDQDNYAVKSYERAIAASTNNKTQPEIVDAVVKGRHGKPDTVINKDEEILKFDAARLRALRVAFPSKADRSGTVTAGNASSLSDGAAALVLVSGKKLKELKASGVLASSHIYHVSSWADAEQQPVDFTTSPAKAIPKALAKIGAEIDSVDFFEINEAFSAVAIANQKILGLDNEKLNVYGGAVAIGHPLGCSGARIIVTLCNVLAQHKDSNGAKRGVAAVCNGGGGASAIVIDLCS